MAGVDEGRTRGVGQPATTFVAGGVRPPVRRGRLTAWAPLLLWMGVILWLSGDRFAASQTRGWLAMLLDIEVLGLMPDAIEVLHAVVRKCAHFVEYAVLGALAFRAFRVSWPAGGWSGSCVAAVLLALAWAGTDELHQASVATHTGSPWDVLIDTVGACTGVLARSRRRVGSPPDSPEHGSNRRGGE